MIHGYRRYSIAHSATPVGESHRAARTAKPPHWPRITQGGAFPMTDSCPPGLPKGYDRYDAVSYTPYPRSIPLARRHVAQLAIIWGHPGVAGDAALLASELCTNALLHGCLRDRLFRVET